MSIFHYFPLSTPLRSVSPPHSLPPPSSALSSPFPLPSSLPLSLPPSLSSLPPSPFPPPSQGYGSFPCEMSVLEVEDDLDWNPNVQTISSMPLSIYDDGAIVYFK